MDYTVTTTPDVGSDSQTSLSNGTYNVGVSGLAYSTVYSWDVNVTDGTYWTNETYTFTTETEPTSWWDTGWLYRKNITIDHTKISATLTGFPVLIDITDSDLQSEAQSSGDDIVFTSESGVKLSHEIEYYDNSDGHLICWVNVTSLSDTVDTILCHLP